MEDKEIYEHILDPYFEDLIPDKEQRVCFEKFCYLFAKAIFDGVEEAKAKFKEEK